MSYCRRQKVVKMFALNVNKCFKILSLLNKQQNHTNLISQVNDCKVKPVSYYSINLKRSLDILKQHLFHDNLHFSRKICELTMSSKLSFLQR